MLLTLCIIDKSMNRMLNRCARRYISFALWDV